MKGTVVDKRVALVCWLITASGGKQHVDLHSHWQHSGHETARNTEKLKHIEELNTIEQELTVHTTNFEPLTLSLTDYWYINECLQCYNLYNN